MTINKEEILEKLANMSVMEIVDLTTMIEKKFNVSATYLANNDSNSIAKEKAEEKTEFNVILKKIGSNKIAVIKTVRSAIGLGLKEAKDLVESAPVTLKENISKIDADSIKKKIEETGAVIEIK